MKSVVITGSTRGIGFGLAREFLLRGHQVLVSGRSQEGVDRALEELASAKPRIAPTRSVQAADQELRQKEPHTPGEQCLGQVCDVADPEAVEALWEAAQRAFGKVDIWINNAGLNLPMHPLWEQSPDALHTLLDTNLYGLMLCSRVALRGMLSQDEGQLWNMEGFGSGGETRSGLTAYGASKCAVRYLNKSLGKEVAGTGVQVCALSPGIVITDLLTEGYDHSSKEWQQAKRIFNILGDKVETVTPWLVEGVLGNTRSGARVAWLTPRKAMGRFLTARFRKRELFAS